MIKKCLIISDGPVPTPEQKKVEGGGLRCWGLARGIQKNNPEIEMTVAYNEIYKSPDKFTNKYKDIKILTWNDSSLQNLITGYDTVVISYCMGDLSIKVSDYIHTDQQLVLDCYVPIYIEVSARQSKDMDLEYSAFYNDVPRWARVLKRGDLFLCANEAQKKFYEGVLAGLGRINPATYGEEIIKIVPYGIYRDKAVQRLHPIQKLIGKDHEKFKKILWFGGIYPWFDLEDLIDAIVKVNAKVPTKFIIVGAKNPFNAHPDFIKKYETIVDYIKNNNLENIVLIQDWVSFESRADWYLDSDVVVVVNKLGPENNLAWRTRLVDFTWANLPIITNGGDPVSNMLVDFDAVAIFEDLSSDHMSNDMIKLLGDSKRLTTIKSNLSKVRERLYWDNVTKELTKNIVNHTRPGDFSKYGFYDPVMEGSSTGSKLKRTLRKVKKVPAYARKYGLKNTYNTINSNLERKIKEYLHTQPKIPRVVVVSHQLDMSGAPFVIMDFAISLKKLYPDLPLEFYTFNPAHHDNIVILNKNGIRPKIIFNKDAVINFNDGDVVVFNTAAQSLPLKSEVFSRLEKGRLSKLFWYVHEDQPELIFGKNEAKLIHSLMEQGKLEIITAAVKTRDHYCTFFENYKNIELQPYQVITPQKYHRRLDSKDFNEKLSFILPGTVGDGRKGQLPIFYAFADFYHQYYKNNPGAYRDFELVYVGLADDFLSRQILEHAPKSLGAHFISYGRVTHEECLDIILKSNFTICYSLRETLPLFVYEGMAAGHPILRNDSSGIEEQLIEGQNGYRIDTSDFEQVKTVIERVLNKKKTSNEALKSMSKTSYNLAIKQEKNTYENLSRTIREALPKSKNV